MRVDTEDEAAGPASDAQHDAPRSAKEVGGGDDGPPASAPAKFDKSDAGQREEVREAAGGNMPTSGINNATHREEQVRTLRGKNSGLQRHARIRGNDARWRA